MKCSECKNHTPNNECYISAIESCPYKMTVQRLIEELQKLDPHKEVYIAFGEEDGMDIEKIEDSHAVFLVNYTEAIDD